MNGTFCEVRARVRTEMSRRSTESVAASQSEREYKARPEWKGLCGHIARPFRSVNGEKNELGGHVREVREERGWEREHQNTPL